MKALLGIGGLLLIAFALWLYSPRHRAETAAEPTHATPEPAKPTPTKVAAATPAGLTIVEEPVAATAATPVKRKAPAGVYYMLERVSKITTDGAVGLNPGERVHLVGKTEGGLRVSNSQIVMEVEPAAVTDDLDLAAQIAKQHATSQKAVNAWMENQKAIAMRLEKETADRQLERDRLTAQSTATVAKHATPAPTPYPSALDRGAYNQHHGISYGPYYGSRYGYRYYVTSDGRTIYY